MLKILLISIPILFVVGSLLHFTYSLSKENKLVGIISPVNESIFEHTKLLLFPLLFFWIIMFFFIKNININNYFLAMLISIIFSIITMISFYYTYKGIIGNNYLLIDILDLLISLIIGQLIANHVYAYSKGMPFIISISIIVLIVILYIYLTYKPLKIPFFLDEKSKTYGINKIKKS